MDMGGEEKSLFRQIKNQQSGFINRQSSTWNRKSSAHLTGYDAHRAQLHAILLPPLHLCGRRT
jgi:hypothetical protein